MRLQPAIVLVDPLLGVLAMLEEPCIIQMNIDRYIAMLTDHPAGEQRTRIELLLAEARAELSQAISALARAISPGDEAGAAVPLQP
jgi:hypothetical protein